MSPVARAAALAILVTLAALVPLHRVSATNERLLEPLSTREIASGVPSGAVLRLASLGHNEAMADIVWLGALSFWGQYFRQSHDADWLDPHINAIIDLDPRFRLVFEWAGAVIMYGGVIDNDSIMAANRVLELGVEQFPFDWSIRFMLGVNYAYELQATNAEEFEQLDEWRAYGVQQLVTAAALPNAPPNLQLLAASLTRRRDGWEQQVRTFRDNYVGVGDTQARTMRRHIEEALPPPEAELLIRARHLTKTIHRHPRWGVLPADLAVLAHPDPLRLYTPSELTPPPFELTR